MFLHKRETSFRWTSVNFFSSLLKIDIRFDFRGNDTRSESCAIELFMLVKIFISTPRLRMYVYVYIYMNILITHAVVLSCKYLCFDTVRVSAGKRDFHLSHTACNSHRNML
jgi:hypothetical protein